MTSRGSSARHRGTATAPNLSRSELTAVADRAQAAAGTPVELLGQYHTILANADRAPPARPACRRSAVPD